MNEIKLKPCPFCGSEAEMCSTVIGFFVECSKLGHIHNVGVLGGGFCIFEQNAAAEWNQLVSKRTEVNQ